MLYPGNHTTSIWSNSVGNIYGGGCKRAVPLLWLKCSHVKSQVNKLKGTCHLDLTGTFVELACLCYISFAESGSLADGRPHSIHIVAWQDGVQENTSAIEKKKLALMLHDTQTASRLLQPTSLRTLQAKCMLKDQVIHREIVQFKSPSSSHCCLTKLWDSAEEVKS